MHEYEGSKAELVRHMHILVVFPTFSFQTHIIYELDQQVNVTRTCDANCTNGCYLLMGSGYCTFCCEEGLCNGANKPTGMNKMGLGTLFVMGLLIEKNCIDYNY